MTKALEDDEIRGRILGRNWDKSLMTFPPCYLQSPLLTDFTPLSKSGLKLVCDVNIVYGKLKTELCLETSTKVYTFMNSVSGQETTSKHWLELLPVTASATSTKTNLDQIWNIDVFVFHSALSGQGDCLYSKFCVWEGATREGEWGGGHLVIQSAINDA